MTVFTFEASVELTQCNVCRKLKCGCEGAVPTCMTANSHDVNTSLKNKSSTGDQVIYLYYHQQEDISKNVFGDKQGDECKTLSSNVC